MKKTFAVLLIALTWFISGCGPSNRANIISVKIVDRINAGGVYYKFEGKDNLEITLDFSFDARFASDLDPKSGDDYRKALFSKLVKGAHLFCDDQEVERTYGYWPEEAGSNYAKEMSLFYVVPQNRSAQSLKFVYDGSVLGEGASGIDKIIHP